MKQEPNTIRECPRWVSFGQRCGLVSRVRQVVGAFCPICQTRIIGNNDQFCASHQAAFDKVQKNYMQWVNAYGSLSKEGYLGLLIGNENSGEWVVEVARFLLKKGQKQISEDGHGQEPVG
jgi:hypothetical protein